jgi:hypothetical protein
MTYAQIQEKMKTAFDKIGELSGALTKAKESLQALEAVEKELKSVAQDAKEGYSNTKDGIVVHLPTFRIVKNNHEAAVRGLEEAKLKVLVANQQVIDLSKDLEIYKAEYRKHEDLLQKYDNVREFSHERTDRPN